MHWIVLVAALPLFLLPASALSQERGCPPRCDLEGIRNRALERSPAAAADAARARIAKARRAEAWALPAQLGDARFELHPTPLRRGNVVTSAQPDVWMAEEAGARMQLQIITMVPLTSWWRIISLWRGATSAVSVAEGEARRQRSKRRIVSETAYRAVQAASARARILIEARGHVRNALSQVERILDEDLPGANETDRLRLELSLSNLDARISQTRGARRRAMAALRDVAALPRRTRLDVPPLPSSGARIGPLSWYLEAARRRRPEIAMGRAATLGARALVSLELGELVPDVGLLGYYRMRDTPLVDDQRSSFIRDLWNTTGAGYALVLDWTIDPVGTAARVGQARADTARADAMRRLALGSVAFDVENAYAESLEATAAMGARARGRTLATTRLDEALRDRTQGRMDARELSQAVSRWLEQELAWHQAAQARLVALARLEEASGLEPGTLTGNE